MSWCPVCGETEKWHCNHGYYDPDGMQIEPDEYFCDGCGFCYDQHVKHPIIDKARQYAKKIGRTAICDEVRWPT